MPYCCLSVLLQVVGTVWVHGCLKETAPCQKSGAACCLQTRLLLEQPTATPGSLSLHMSHRPAGPTQPQACKQRSSRSWSLHAEAALNAATQLGSPAQLHVRQHAPQAPVCSHPQCLASFQTLGCSYLNGSSCTGSCPPAHMTTQSIQCINGQFVASPACPVPSELHSTVNVMKPRLGPNWPPP
jgi:hypothetical protein